MSVAAARRTIHIGLAVEHQLSEQTSRDITHLSRRSLGRYTANSDGEPVAALEI